MIIAKELEGQKAKLALEEHNSTAKKNNSFNPEDLWLNKKGCHIGSVPIPKCRSKEQLQIVRNVGRAQYTSQKLDNHSYVHPALYGDSRTRLFSRWTSHNYGKTGCYINHCPGFVITSNVVPLNYAFPQISVSRGEQFDVTLGVSKVCIILREMDLLQVSFLFMFGKF
nr:uncharacterized protein LOC107016280 [Ipomoea batatas]